MTRDKNVNTEQPKLLSNVNIISQLKKNLITSKNNQYKCFAHVNHAEA